MLTTGVTALLFPLRGEMKICEASVTKDGRAHVSRLLRGSRHSMVISIDEYLDGAIQSFTVIYTYKPNGVENRWIRENMRLGWRGEILIINNWPGRVDPNANEEEYGEFDYDTGEYVDKDTFMDLELDVEDEEENAQRAVGKKSFNLFFYNTYSWSYQPLQ